MVFNIRDTNRRKCSWKRDSFWLYLGSWASASDEQNCNLPYTNNMFKEWIYTIKEWINNEWDRLVYAERLNKLNDSSEQEAFYTDFDSFFSDDISDYKESREKSRVTFTWTYMYLSWSLENGVLVTWEIGDLLWDGIEYYRILRVYGI